MPKGVQGKWTEGVLDAKKKKLWTSNIFIQNQVIYNVVQQTEGVGGEKKKSKRDIYMHFFEGRIVSHVCVKEQNNVSSL